MDHIHFIGNSYYSKFKFIKEALKYGVTRKIPHNQFKNIHIGDRVFLIQGGQKGGRVFGYFTVDRLTLENKELIEDMEKNGYIQAPIAGFTPMAVDRECGSYTVTGSFTMYDPKATMDYIKSKDSKEVGSVMVGGQFYGLSTVGIHLEDVLTNIPHSRGIRPFDFRSFKEAVLWQMEHKKRVRIIGMWYDNPSDKHPVSDIDGLVLEIEDYLKKNP